jgi:2,3-bisphosphoglycerate-independent phosphoglycerate mutase
MLTITDKTVLLCILDGWGYSPNLEYNAIARANLKFMPYLLANFPNSLLDASGPAVGLPLNQMGNSEVGHMTIGAGRVILQDLERINQAIKNNLLQNNKELLNAIKEIKGTGKSCHVFGLISDGGVHSHIDHIVACIDILRQHGIKYHLHAITDGRDAPPNSASKYLDILKDVNIIPSSIGGRFYAMDRDNRFDRTKRYYDAIVNCDCPKFNSIKDVLFNHSDEFIEPHISNDYYGISDGDLVLMANFRGDRVRQILTSLFDGSFESFQTKKLAIKGIGMTSYSKELSSKISTMFPNEYVRETLSEIISKYGYKQLKVAETEKYAHVTYFFNGGREEPYPNEDRILVPSPKVKTYDEAPEMAANEITAKVIEAIDSKQYQFICVNFANADMVGHTANMEATIQACKTIDSCLEAISKAIVRNNAEMLITSDHGNAEQLFDLATDQKHTAHTNNKVPLIYFGHNAVNLKDGELKDIAGMVKSMLSLPQ